MRREHRARAGMVIGGLVLALLVSGTPMPAGARPGLPPLCAIPHGWVNVRVHIPSRDPVVFLWTYGTFSLGRRASCWLMPAQYGWQTIQARSPSSATLQRIQVEGAWRYHVNLSMGRVRFLMNPDHRTKTYVLFDYAKSGRR